MKKQITPPTCPICGNNLSDHHAGVIMGQYLSKKRQKIPLAKRKEIATKASHSRKSVDKSLA